jgi:hypothetical protein
MIYALGGHSAASRSYTWRLLVMRRALVLIVVLAACTSKGSAGRDSAVSAGDVGSALKASDIAGTWTGTTMAGTSDSVASHWTITSQDGTTSALVIAGVPDTIRVHNTFAGDSLVSTSEPFTSPSHPGSQLTFVAVGRLDNGTLRGTLVESLASKPDSVVARDHWEARKQ